MLIHISEADFFFFFLSFIVVKCCRKIEVTTSEEREFSANIKKRRQLSSMPILAYELLCILCIFTTCQQKLHFHMGYYLLERNEEAKVGLFGWLVGFCGGR